MRGRLFVVAGPSGVGKSTLERRLLAEVDNLAYSVSATTRPPRPAEEEGRDYFFVSRKEFDRLVKAGELAEWAEFYGHCYGTPARFIEETLACGQDLLVDVEVEGMAQLRDRFAEAIYILIVPPSKASLKERLLARGTEGEAAVRQRLKRAFYELSQLLAVYQERPEGERSCEYLIVNDNL
ncbi:MAG: guanylate kinase, partial [Deltaproteobacteria bacterium]|nr:guanylate kinase [Deltaproteobacteria bacterium]